MSRASSRIFSRFGCCGTKRPAVGPERLGRGKPQLPQRVAFDDMGVHRLGLGVFAHNSTAVALYERLGFVREGVSREVVEVDGAWWSSIEMSMLDREWHGSGATTPSA